MGLFSFPQVDSNVNVIFSVDGDEYAVEQSSNNSFFPYKIPTPVGPHIL